MVQLFAKDIIQSTVAISNLLGLQVYESLKKNISGGTKTTLSFEGIENLSTAFCNASIGKLCMEFGLQKVDSLLELTGLSDNEVWLEKIRNAKILGGNESLRKADQENISELFA